MSSRCAAARSPNSCQLWLVAQPRIIPASRSEVPVDGGTVLCQVRREPAVRLRLIVMIGRGDDRLSDRFLVASRNRNF